MVVLILVTADVVISYFLAAVSSRMLGIYAPGREAGRDRACVIPFDRELMKRQRVDFGPLSDEDILALPASVATHGMRTAATRNVQVIGPRNVTRTGSLVPCNSETVGAFAHTVGVSTSAGIVWRCLDVNEAVNMDRMPGEPLDKLGEPFKAVRKTQTETLKAADDTVGDPIWKAWFAALGAINLQRKNDVGGAYDNLQAAYEVRYCCSPGELFGTRPFTTQIPSRLWRYAAGASDGLPAVLAPIHVKKVVGAKAAAGDRHDFGTDIMIDFTGLRVTAITLYLAAAASSGLSILDLALPGASLLGDSHIGPNHENVMTYYPAPGSAWSCASNTFAVHAAGSNPRLCTAMPSALKEALKSNRPELSEETIINHYGVATLWNSNIDETPASTAVISDIVKRLTSTRAIPLSFATLDEKGSSAIIFATIRAMPLGERTRFISTVEQIREMGIGGVFDGTEGAGTMLLMSQKLSSVLAVANPTLSAHMLHAANALKMSPSALFDTMGAVCGINMTGMRPNTGGWGILLAAMLLFGSEEACKVPITEELELANADIMAAYVSVPLQTTVGTSRVDFGIVMRTAVTMATQLGSAWWSGQAEAAALVSKHFFEVVDVHTAAAASVASRCHNAVAALVRSASVTYVADFSTAEEFGKAVFTVKYDDEGVYRDWLTGVRGSKNAAIVKNCRTLPHFSSDFGATIEAHAEGTTTAGAWSNLLSNRRFRSSALAVVTNWRTFADHIALAKAHVWDAILSVSVEFAKRYECVTESPAPAATTVAIVREPFSFASRPPVTNGYYWARRCPNGVDLVESIAAIEALHSVVILTTVFSTADDFHDTIALISGAAVAEDVSRVSLIE